MVLCANGCHVYRVGSLRCTCGQAANGYPPKREEAEMYLNSWMCPNGNHIFTWASTSSSRTGQPSGFCRCGLFYYNAQEKQVSMMFPPNVTVNPNPFSGYHPAGYRQPKPDPAPDVPLAVLKAARDDVKAQWLSADGQRAYKEMSDGIRVFYWDEKAKVFGSSFPSPEGLPEDAVKL